MMDVLRSFTGEEISRMRRNMGIAYNKIFKNDSTLVRTTRPHTHTCTHTQLINQSLL